MKKFHYAGINNLFLNLHNNQIKLAYQLIAAPVVVLRGWFIPQMVNYINQVINQIASILLSV